MDFFKFLRKPIVKIWAETIIKIKNAKNIQEIVSAIVTAIGATLVRLIKAVISNPYFLAAVAIIAALIMFFEIFLLSGQWQNYSYKFNMDFTEGLATEQTYVNENALYKAFYDVVSETSYYQVFYVSQLDTEPTNVILKAFLGEQFARQTHEDVKALQTAWAATWDSIANMTRSILGFQTVDPRQVVHDANYAGISGLKQATSFTEIEEYYGDVEDLDYYRDYYARENNFLISSGLLKELNSKVLNNGLAGDDVSKVIYPEAFTKPVQFSRDYMRVQPYINDEGETDYRDYVYITKRVIMDDIKDTDVKVTNTDTYIDEYKSWSSLGANTTAEKLDMEGMIVSAPSPYIYEWVVLDINDREDFEDLEGTGYENLAKDNTSKYVTIPDQVTDGNYMVKLYWKICSAGDCTSLDQLYDNYNNLDLTATTIGSNGDIYFSTQFERAYFDSDDGETPFRVTDDGTLLYFSLPDNIKKHAAGAGVIEPSNLFLCGPFASAEDAENNRFMKLGQSYTLENRVYDSQYLPKDSSDGYTPPTDGVSYATITLKQDEETEEYYYSFSYDTYQIKKTKVESDEDSPVVEEKTTTDKKNEDEEEDNAVYEYYAQGPNNHDDEIKAPVEYTFPIKRYQLAPLATDDDGLIASGRVYINLATFNIPVVTDTYRRSEEYAERLGAYLEAHTEIFTEQEKAEEDFLTKAKNTFVNAVSNIFTGQGAVFEFTDEETAKYVSLFEYQEVIPNGTYGVEWEYEHDGYNVTVIDKESENQDTKNVLNYLGDYIWGRWCYSMALAIQKSGEYGVSTETTDQVIKAIGSLNTSQAFDDFVADSKSKTITIGGIQQKLTDYVASAYIPTSVTANFNGTKSSSEIYQNAPATNNTVLELGVDSSYNKGLDVYDKAHVGEAQLVPILKSNEGKNLITNLTGIEFGSSYDDYSGLANRFLKVYDGSETEIFVDMTDNASLKVKERIDSSGLLAEGIAATVQGFDQSNASSIGAGSSEEYPVQEHRIDDFEFRNTSDILDTTSERFRDSYGYLIPMEVRSVRDYGLGSILEYIEGLGVTFKKGQYYDETYNEGGVNAFITALGAGGYLTSDDGTNAGTDTSDVVTAFSGDADRLTEISQGFYPEEFMSLGINYSGSDGEVSGNFVDDFIHPSEMTTAYENALDLIGMYETSDASGTTGTVQVGIIGSASDENSTGESAEINVSKDSNGLTYQLGDAALHTFVPYKTGTNAADVYEHPEKYYLSWVKKAEQEDNENILQAFISWVFNDEGLIRADKDVGEVVDFFENGAAMSDNLKNNFDANNSGAPAEYWLGAGKSQMKNKFSSSISPFDYLTDDDIEHMFLISSALTFLGRFDYTYKDTVEMQRDLSAYDKQRLIGAYYNDRYFYVDEVELEEVGFYSGNYEITVGGPDCYDYSDKEDSALVAAQTSEASANIPSEMGVLENTVYEFKNVKTPNGYKPHTSGNYTTFCKFTEIDSGDCGIKHQGPCDCEGECTADHSYSCSYTTYRVDFKTPIYRISTKNNDYVGYDSYEWESKIYASLDDIWQMDGDNFRFETIDTASAALSGQGAFYVGNYNEDNPINLEDVEIFDASGNEYFKLMNNPGHSGGSWSFAEGFLCVRPNKNASNGSFDNRNIGEPQPLYRLYTGAVYKVYPKELGSYFENEALKSWKSRLIFIQDEVDQNNPYQNPNKKEAVMTEKEDRLSYFIQYLSYFETYMSSNLKDSRAINGYQDMIQGTLNPFSTSQAQYTEDVASMFITEAGKDYWAKTYEKLEAIWGGDAANVSNIKKTMGQILQGLVEEDLSEQASINLRYIIKKHPEVKNNDANLAAIEKIMNKTREAKGITNFNWDFLEGLEWPELEMNDGTKLQTTFKDYVCYGWSTEIVDLSGVERTFTINSSKYGAMNNVSWGTPQDVTLTVSRAQDDRLDISKVIPFVASKFMRCLGQTEDVNIGIFGYFYGSGFAQALKAEVEKSANGDNITTLSILGATGEEIKAAAIASGVYVDDGVQNPDELDLGKVSVSKVNRVLGFINNAGSRAEVVNTYSAPENVEVGAKVDGFKDRIKNPVPTEEAGSFTGSPGTITFSNTQPSYEALVGAICTDWAAAHPDMPFSESPGTWANIIFAMSFTESGCNEASQQIGGGGGRGFLQLDGQHKTITYEDWMAPWWPDGNTSDTLDLSPYSQKDSNDYRLIARYNIIWSLENFANSDALSAYERISGNANPDDWDLVLFMIESHQGAGIRNAVLEVVMDKYGTDKGWWNHQAEQDVWAEVMEKVGKDDIARRTREQDPEIWAKTHKPTGKGVFGSAAYLIHFFEHYMGEDLGLSMSVSSTASNPTFTKEVKQMMLADQRKTLFTNLVLLGNPLTQDDIKFLYLSAGMFKNEEAVQSFSDISYDTLVTDKFEEFDLMSLLGNEKNEEEKGSSYLASEGEHPGTPSSLGEMFGIDSNMYLAYSSSNNSPDEYITMMGIFGSHGGMISWDDTDGIIGPLANSVEQPIYYYSQMDPTWKEAGLKYATSSNAWTIADSSCGPSSLAIALSTTFQEVVNVPEVVTMALNQNGLCPNAGSYHNMFDKVVAQINKGAGEDIVGIQNFSSASPSNVQSFFEEHPNGVLILSGSSSRGKASPFSSGGHFIAVVGYSADGDVYYVADPAEHRYTNGYGEDGVRGYPWYGGLERDRIGSMRGIWRIE